MLYNGGVFVSGGGFDTGSLYACQFTSRTQAGAFLHVNSTPAAAWSNNLVPCYIPHWNFTSDSRPIVGANVSVWIVSSLTKTLLDKLPFFGTVGITDQYVFDRCRDGIQNGVETNTDCGGLCPNLCPGAVCSRNADCVTASCVQLPQGKRCAVCKSLFSF